MWVDEGEVSAAWAAPGGPPSTRTVRPLVLVLAAVLVLALLVGVVWRLGGFERRTDVVRNLDVGSTITTGPYELRFTSATVQQRTNLGDKVVWYVMVTGEGRTTGDETIEPSINGDGSMFVAKDPASGQVQTPRSMTFRPGQGSYGDGFTPGLPVQPLHVEFEFGDGYQPAPTITFVTFDLQFTDTSLLRNNEPVWNNADTQYRQSLPLKVLPPQIY